MALLVWSVSATADTGSGNQLRVGMPSPGQVPYFWRNEQGEFEGIYADTLRLIAEDLGIELAFVPLSQARLRRHFIAGEIDLEAGVPVNLETSASLKQVSLYSRPFGIVNEVIIYRPELSFPVFILKDLEGKRVATVRGSSVPDKLIREDFSNQWQIAQRVHRGWNEIGLMKEVSALRYRREGQLNYEISLPYVSHPVTFRLHRSRGELLDGMNASIEKLEQQGELERVVCKYLCGVNTEN
ncbi:substrate-binding periplasmic protein [Motiliproteus sp.]|uniref:substrate-binding periplasmic protein n=1 Tax=Motiliproteus sp. TaxID=1898955 RepID=UPI003BAD3705